MYFRIARPWEYRGNELEESWVWQITPEGTRPNAESGYMPGQGVGGVKVSGSEHHGIYLTF